MKQLTEHEIEGITDNELPDSAEAYLYNDNVHVTMNLDGVGRACIAEAVKIIQDRDYELSHVNYGEMPQVMNDNDVVLVFVRAE